jgi:NTE family protein
VADLPLFEGLAPEALAAVCAKLEWFALPGGAELFRQDDPPDALFIVVSGSLGVYQERADGSEARIGQIKVGESVGEMAMISGKLRTATIRALRDSELVRFAKADFEALVTQHPRSMLQLARLIVGRLEAAQGRRPRPGGHCTFAVLPQDAGVPAQAFARSLGAALASYGTVERVEHAENEQRTSDWFHRIEASRDFIVYVADHSASPWTQLCLRQADCVLLLAHAGGTPAPWPALSAFAEPLRARLDLVLLHDQGKPSGTARWLAQHAFTLHHHLRGPADMQRLARILTGRGVGIVFSGGGARGFAHLGVIKALREVGMPIDLVGGNSMGAIIGAGLANDWSEIELRTAFRRAFVETNPLSDYTVPLVSLIGGRKVSRLLREAFGEVAIEDLWLPFFCLSANLTRGEAAVHRSGLLWRWLRASVAIPGVLAPVFDRGEVHVDGGVINNLPVDVMRDIGRGLVIGVDVVSDHTFTAKSEGADLPPLWRLMMPRGGKQVPGILQILWRAGTVNSDAAAAALRDETDLLLRPSLESIDLLNWKAFDRAVDLGYRHAMEKLERMPRPLPGGGGVLPL